MSDLQLIDYDVINTLSSELGMTPAEALPLFLDSLENDVTQSLSEMDLALESSNSVRLQRAAHKIKGGCKTLGAIGVATIAEEMETTDYGDMMDIAAKKVQQLKEAWQVSIVELHKAAS